MRRTLEDYRATNAPANAPAMPVDPPRAHFLGTQQDAALTRRVIVALAACAALAGAAVLMLG